MQLLHQVSIFVRLYSEGEKRLPDQQLLDLMDAIHNIPEMLLEYEGSGYDETDIRRIFLQGYDEQWAGDGGFSLVTVLGDAIRRVRERDASV